jgi:putative ABC transport system substrate-binding protein
MKRREFIAITGGAAAWPLTAWAQQSREMRRIAVLMGTATTDLGKSYLGTFLQRLEQLGWANGRNARVETRWWTGTVDEMRPVVGELIAFSPDVVMAFSNPAVALLKSMASTTPVVFVGVGDPIGDGFVSSLAHPGGNITGFAGFDGPIGGKWLEVLKETVPQITRVMMIMNPETPIHQAFWRSPEAAAPRFGVEATSGGEFLRLSGRLEWICANTQCFTIRLLISGSKVRVLVRPPAFACFASSAGRSCCLDEMSGGCCTHR